MNRDHRSVLCLWDPEIAHPVSAHHNRRWPRACPWQISTITRKPALALWTKMIYWLSLSKSSCSLMACLTSKLSLQISQVRYRIKGQFSFRNIYIKLISQEGSWKIGNLKFYRDLFLFMALWKDFTLKKKSFWYFFFKFQF